MWSKEDAEGVREVLVRRDRVGDRSSGNGRREWTEMGGSA